MLSEQRKLTKEQMADVGVGSTIRPDELKGLLKWDVPNIEKV